ncbi:hypothetical protein BGZ63DRAFT_457733 [Mariannaea sp. PMI_226]|nr:hypothetical protein BGZ63DRAFT_457733 [Mariannaea sp. PMI_226]
MKVFIALIIACATSVTSFVVLGREGETCQLDSPMFRCEDHLECVEDPTIDPSSNFRGRCRAQSFIAVAAARRR